MIILDLTEAMEAAPEPIDPQRLTQTHRLISQGDAYADLFTRSAQHYAGPSINEEKPTA